MTGTNVRRVVARTAASAVLGLVSWDPSAAAATTGRTTAVIILKKANQSAPTPTQVKQQVFGLDSPPDPYSVKQFWLTQTYGRVKLVGVKSAAGDVFGPYTVNTCDLTQATQQEGTAAASKQGFRFNSYKSVIWIMPSSCPGGAAGSGEQPGTQVWVYGLDRYVIDHELGHNFDNPHASTLRCFSPTNPSTVVPLSSHCNAPDEYGDPFDPMGGGGTYPPNDYSEAIPYEMEPWRKLNIGAMSLASAPTENIAGTHSYMIAPLENASGIRMLRLPDGRGDGRMFDLSFRQPTGLFDRWYNEPLDGSHDGNQSALHGVLVNWDPKATASPTHRPSLANSYLLDMTPSTAGSYSDPCTSSSPPGCNPCVSEPPGCSQDQFVPSNDWIAENAFTHQPMSGFEDAPLPVGQSWSDPRTGLTLKVDSAGSTGALVTITYGSGAVDVAAPTAPGSLHAAVGSGGKVTLSWQPSVDSVDGVKRYIVTRDGKTIQTSVTTTHTADKPGSGTHIYTVRAVDGAGNAGPAARVSVKV